MRLDHISYVASHDQISDVVNRIGSQIGTAFVDGGIHPKFGTRNFTAPLLNGQYIEVVCPLDHPATETTPFGQAVKKKASAGGGWLTWVISVDDIRIVEKLLERNSVEGERKKPDGSVLKWRQIGVLDLLEDSKNPFFIEWISTNHPSRDGNSVAQLHQIIFNGLPSPLVKKLRLNNKIDLTAEQLIWNESFDEDVNSGIQMVKIKHGEDIINLS